MLSFFLSFFQSVFLPILLLTAGAYFLIDLRAFFLRAPKKTFSLIFPKEQTAKKESFSAFFLALAGTLGVGNIVGVATALHAGGAGALFWMWVSAFFSMLLKYAETALAIHHRVKRQDGYHGGLMYYLSSQLKQPILAALFCVLCIGASFFVGNLMQVQTVVVALERNFSLPALVVCLAFAILCALVCGGGAQGILRFAYRLIPALSLGYLLLSLAVLCKNIAVLPTLFSDIFAQAFSCSALFGGVGGYGIKTAVRYGVARGLLSNEAGCGTAPLAHSASSVTTPVRQGCMGVMEVAVDTLLLCSATGGVILLCGNAYLQLDGVELALFAFASFYGDWIKGPLSVAMALFAFASMVGWFFYGTECLSYLTTKKRWHFCYLVCYCALCLWIPVIEEKWMWFGSDFLLGAMTVLQVGTLLAKRKEVHDLTVEAFPSLFRKNRGKTEEKTCILK